MEKILFGHITQGMAISFILGVFCLVLFMWYKNDEVKNGYSTKRYLKPSLPNILFHIVSSALVLLLLREIGDVILENWFKELEPGKTYDMTLAGASGMFGSVLVSYFLEKWVKQRNANDQNIKHVHDDNCEHN